LPAVHLEPGEVIVRSWPVVGQFHIGRWPAPLRTDDNDEFLERLAQAWSTAGVRVNAVVDVAPWKYNKLISNLANAVGALSAAGADVSAVTAALRAEGEHVLRSAGIEFVSFDVSNAARADGPTPRPVPGHDTRASNSTWQSLARNTGNVETDYFNGEIVRIAHRHGIMSPVNAALARASRDAVRNGVGPGGYSATQLEELLGISAASGGGAPRRH
jgi:2-dehydropantoate 2-reductase